MERAAILGPWAGARVLVLSPTPTHPQDYGNRKRIFSVCKRISDEGARLTFLHYPAELEWRETLPWRAERAMIETWAQYYTLAPTRALHAHPKSRYHMVDAWWDEAIGGFLRWLFSVQSFDVFIVNYSWLSKAFEFAPRSVFKILDTHDKFSGRREMLEALGLAPEFFFTTEAQEKIALNRADLVWAIKDEECTFFQSISPTPILTLSHVDPFQVLERPPRDPDGYLRVGIIGARNNINRTNIREFLKIADPIFRDAFAPLKVVIAGSVCDLLTDLSSPFVELRGRIADVEDFYRSVDCVAIPMGVSSGLKIKTGEAISLGLPVVSLAHAFEGYEVSDKLHALADFPEMANALVDLSFGSRERLDMLAEASKRTHAMTSALIAGSFRRSGVMARDGRRTIMIVVDSRAFVAGSIFNLVLVSAHNYLRGLANVVILVVRGSAADIVDNPAVVDRFRQVVVSDDLADAQQLSENLAALGVDVFNAEAFLRRMQPRILMVDALHPALFEDCCLDAIVMSRTEMIAFSQGGVDFRVPGKGYRRAFVATPNASRDVAALSASVGADCLLEPCFWQPNKMQHARGRSPDAGQRVALLGSPSAPAIAMAAAMARSWGLNPHIVCGLGDDTARPATVDADVPCSRADDYVAALAAGQTPLPDFAVDLSIGRLGLGLCRELLQRFHVPVVVTSTVSLHGSIDIHQMPLRATTEGELWNAFRSLAMDSRETQERILESVWRDLESDRGWAWIWRYSSRLFETNDAEFA